MGLGKNLKNEITEFGVLVMVIVIMSVILLKMRISPTVSCTSAYPVFSEASELCCVNATCEVNTSAVSTYSTVGTFVDALSEPQNWVAIVVIAIIGWGLVSYFKNKSK